MPKTHTRSVAGTINDPTIRFADLELEGKSYKLAYNFNVIAKAERLISTLEGERFNLLSGLENLGDVSADQLRGLLYAALLVCQPHMTLDDVGNMIQPFNTRDRRETITPITRALAEAYGLSMPEKKRDPLQAEDAAAESSD